MDLRKLLTGSALLLVFSARSLAQMVCPPNIDFELGNTSMWNYYIGTCCPAGLPSTPTAGVVPCRHTLTNATGLVGCTVTPYVGSTAFDEYGGFPVLAPGGGAYSFKLGNKGTGSQAERATYFVHVPATATNYSLVYRYAVVLQDEGHPPEQQPRFVVRAYDSATTASLPCAEYNYVASATLPGFTASTCASCLPVPGDPTDPADFNAPIWYKDWTTATIDLSGAAGTTVGIDFTTTDCSLGGHFGYGYFDLSCGLFQISSSTCDTLTPPTLTAPFGFASYGWYDSATFSIFYGSGSSITIPTPPGPVTIAVILTPFPGFGCPDTLYSRIFPAHMALHPTNDTSICRGRATIISPNATDVVMPLTYSWAPATGLSCTTCANPWASPTTTTAYTVTVTNLAGCSMSHVFNITVLPDVNTSVTYDTPTCAGYADASATVIPSGGTTPYTYFWSTTPTQTTPTATGIPAGTYMVVVFDTLGCTDTNTVTIPNPMPKVVTVVTSSNPTTCLGSNGSITLGGGHMTPGATYTIQYIKDGVTFTQVVTADGSGQVVLTGLTAGTYTNITVILAICPYSNAGPVVLSDPPNPDLSGVTSNSFVCVGDSLLLFATSTTPGVMYSWNGPGGYFSGAQNPVIYPATLANAGVYSVTVVANACYNYSSTIVDVRPLPVPVATSNTPVCSNDTLFLYSTSSSGFTSFLWTGPNLFTAIVQNPYVVHVQTVSTGVYTVAITLNGCTVSDTVSVLVNQTPDPPFVTDTNYCQYDAAVPLTATGINMLWYTSATGGTGSPVVPVPSTAASSNTSWWVTQTSPEGCVSDRAKISARVWEYPRLQLLQTDIATCLGKYVTFTADNVKEGNSGTTWQFETPDSIVNVNPVHHAFNSLGTFTVSVSAYYNYCPDTIMTTSVRVYPYATIDLGNDTSICPGSNPIELSPKVNTYGGTPTWKWNTGQTTPKIVVGTPGTYMATVNINGCESSDSVVIAKDCYINIPNIFTPNGDGINDYFFPRSLLTRGLTKFSMSIYNRWGQVVFESTTLDGRGWDGSFNGVPQPEGVFIYVINAEFKDGQIEHHQGNITLMK